MIISWFLVPVTSQCNNEQEYIDSNYIKEEENIRCHTQSVCNNLDSNFQ